jgi:enoyl-CoA hydratase/carnithine racemase
MSYADILFSTEARIARITLNRPDAGNAVNERLAEELADVCRGINEDDDIYVVVITGAGEAFCTGSDTDTEFSSQPAKAISAIECPVVAAINGDALDQGLEMALSCDIRIASDKARFGLTRVARGLIPADGGTQRLPRIVGRGKALEMLLTADKITAAEALEMGLVSRVFTPGELTGEVQKLAETIAAKGPIALKYLKEAVNQGMDMTMEQGLRLEADLYFLLHTTADRTEGIQAFREKRNPGFKAK